MSPASKPAAPPRPRKRRPARRDDQALRQRIVQAARERLFSEGFSALKMEDLATDLGISKKTLYLHFSGKLAISRAALEAFAAEARADAEQLLGDTRLTFLEKLRGFAIGMVERFTRFHQDLLNDIAHHAPSLHRYVDEVRGRNLPYIFGRFVEAGQLAGMVRDDVSPVFASEFFLHAVQGMLHPASLKKSKLMPADVFDQSLRIFFGGLLTPKGHEDYEKLFPQRAR